MKTLYLSPELQVHCYENGVIEFNDPHYTEPILRLSGYESEELIKFCKMFPEVKEQPKT